MGSSGVQELGISRVREFRSSRVREFGCSRVPEFRSSGFRRWWNTKKQKCEWRQSNQPIALLLNSMHPACTCKYEPQTAVEVMVTVWKNCMHRLAPLPQYVQPVSATTTVCQPSQFTIGKIVLYILKRAQFWNTLPLTYNGWNPYTV